MTSLDERFAVIEVKHADDAERYANADESICMLCDAAGADKRSLFIDCFYAVDEVVPEAISLRKVDPAPTRGQGFYLRICKTCRGRLLGKLGEWRDECVSLRGIPKDHDGCVESTLDRDIPVRVHGTTVMMNQEEWETWRADRDREDD